MTYDDNRAVVECAHAAPCRDDHHGWDCPLSDPQGDVLLGLLDPAPNPLHEAARLWLVDWFIVSRPRRSK